MIDELSHRDSVEAVVRLRKGDASADRLLANLTNIQYNEDLGFTADATVDDTVDNKVLRPHARGLDDALPATFGAAELIAAGPDTTVNPSGRPVAPTSSAQSSGYRVDVAIDVTAPIATAGKININSGGQCIRDQTSSSFPDDPSPSSQFPGNATFTVHFTIVDTGDCWASPSIAVWQVALNPPGVDQLNTKYAYITVSQYAPYLFSSECHGIAQPGRISCSGQQFNSPQTAPVTLNA